MLSFSKSNAICKESLKGAYTGMKVQLTRSNLIEHNMAAELQRRIVSHPDSTFMLTIDDGKSDWMILIVDREAIPREGSVMLVYDGHGFRLRRCRDPQSPPDGLWGIVIWELRRP